MGGTVNDEDALSQARKNFEDAIDDAEAAADGAISTWSEIVAQEHRKGQRWQTFWLVVAITGFGIMAIGVIRLLFF